MRKATKFFFFVFTLAALTALLLVHSSYQIRADRKFLDRKKTMVRQFALTDLCLFTEASYTRHISQADRYTPFQDSPLALEHFPSGSILLPPDTLKKMK